ncbi:hypothetical protein J7M22_02875 [Candidatus Poribacteria bacterium]|nr:hypothetical protein [Candidatus Poribacteria bacterium]
MNGLQLLDGWIKIGGPEAVGAKSNSLAVALIYKAIQLHFPQELPISNLEAIRLSGLTRHELYPARNRLCQFRWMGEPVFTYTRNKNKEAGVYSINYQLLLNYGISHEINPKIGLIPQLTQEVSHEINPKIGSISQLIRDSDGLNPKIGLKPLLNPDQSRDYSETKSPSNHPPNAEKPDQSIEEEIEEDEIEIKDEIEEDDWSYVEKLLCHAPGSPKIMLSGRENRALLELQRKGIPASFAAEVIRQRVREMETKSDVIYNAQMYLIRCIENAWAERRKSSPVVAAPTLRQDGCDRCGRRGVELVETRRGKLCEFCREELGL